MPAPSESELVLRRTLIRRIDSMSDSLCLATLQLFVALVRSHDPAIIDCLLPPAHPTLSSTDGDETSASDAVLADAPFDPSLDAFSLLFDGLGDPRSRADFADTLVDVQRERHAHSSLDTELPIAPPLHQPRTSATSTSGTTAAPQPISPPCSAIHLLVPSLSSDDRALFAGVCLNRLDGWLESSHDATNVLLSALLAALACDRRPHIQLWMMGRQTAVQAGGAGVTAAAPGGEDERSVLWSVVRVWRKGRRREHRLTNFTERLAACKAAMDGRASTVCGESAARPTNSTGANNVDVQRFLHSWLLLEAAVIEWCGIQYSEQQTRTPPLIVRHAAPLVR